MSHTVRQMHKCVMEQMDRTCFLYTLRTPDKEKMGSITHSNFPSSESGQLVPANLTDQNYQCYLFQAESDTVVS